MNIKNRIKKIEENLNSKNSGFCGCFGKRFEAIADFVYDNKPFKQKDVAVPSGDYCYKCKKPVNVAMERAFEKTLESVYGEATQ
jgi:hypothetical protein